MTHKERLEEAFLRLAKAKVEVDAAQREVDGLYRQIGAKRRKNANEPEEESPKSNGGARAPSLQTRVEGFLRTHPGEHGYEEIAAGVEGKPGTVRSILNRLRSDERVEYLGRNRWAAAKQEGGSMKPG